MINPEQVIPKPWGYEYVAFQNGEFAVWRLFIKSGEVTSYHCHPNKKTMMIVLSGQVKCRWDDKVIVLKPFDSVVIEKGIPHSSESMSEEGVALIEIDSPPLLTDIIRLEDKYGREGKPYFPD